MVWLKMSLLYSFPMIRQVLEMIVPVQVCHIVCSVRVLVDLYLYRMYAVF